jgi:pimeloyl-ACP methyl ester carboxylesterase
MKRTLLPLTAWLAGLAGCSADYCAKSLVCHGSITGTARQMLLGSPEKLIARGKIDLHRRIQTQEDIIIDVWAIRSRKQISRGTVLLLHGLWDSKARLYGLGQELADIGFDVILPDNRSHGRSTGRFITWGAKEKEDLRRVVDELTGPDGLSETIYVFGVSMGGCIAVQYAAHEPRCAGVVAVAPAAGAQQVLRRMFPLMSPEKIQQTRQAVREMADFDICQASAIQAAADLSCPLVVIHGRLDATVPYWHGREILEASPGPKAMHSIWWAGHATILLGRDRWFAERINELAQGKATGESAVLPGRLRPQPTTSGDTHET